MVVQSFKGLLTDGGQDQIRLSTIKGKVGYKIVKLEIIPEVPGTVDQESVVKIFKTQQTTINGEVNFSEGDLLGVAYIESTTSTAPATIGPIIFDNEIFNQDIFVTHKDVGVGGRSGNYYLELEVIPLTDQGAEYTTLKDIRTQLKIS